MMRKEFYKGHYLLLYGFQNDWSLLINYAPYLWRESDLVFNSLVDAIAYGKQQIDILLSKSLNL